MITVAPELLQWLTVEEREELDAVLVGSPPDNLADYVHASFPGRYDLAAHHRLIIERLEAVERGECKRLMIFMPPRRGKSELASVRFPAWYLGRHPDESIIGASHTASLAYDFSRKVRRQIADSDWPFDTVDIASDEGAVGQWGIAGRRGQYIAAGVGGAITGKGGNLIIDDPVKSREQADSAVYRQRVYDWYQNDAYTRLPPNGWVILIQTRWHSDDLAGRLLSDMAAGGDQWDVLELREIAEEGDDDPLGRAPGDALWPARFPPEATRTIRMTQPRTWFPLFQQRPQAVSGGLFKLEWFERRYDAAVLPEFQMVVQTVDSAFGEDVANDPSVVATWGATVTHLYLLDVWCERVAYPDLIRAIRDQYAKWLHLSPWVWIENKASGQSAIQTLRRDSGIPVMEFEVGTRSKVSRAQDASPYFAARRVLLPAGAPFVADFIAEHVGFPTVAHDDQVDTTSMAVKILTGAVAVPGDPDDEGGGEAEEASDVRAIA